jgi:hypothetical protein
MSKTILRAKTSVRQFGGKIEDYLDIHSWFDETESWTNDFTHQAFRHHTQGIFEAEAKFGYIIENSDGKRVPVRVICETHIKEDLGFIPTAQEWLENMEIVKWMGYRDRELTHTLKEESENGYLIGEVISKINISKSKTS